LLKIRKSSEIAAERARRGRRAESDLAGIRDRRAVERRAVEFGAERRRQRITLARGSREATPVVHDNNFIAGRCTIGVRRERELSAVVDAHVAVDQAEVVAEAGRGAFLYHDRSGQAHAPHNHLVHACRQIRIRREDPVVAVRAAVRSIERRELRARKPRHIRRRARRDVRVQHARYERHGRRRHQQAHRDHSNSLAQTHLTPPH
jgi:hypothetical protein